MLFISKYPKKEYLKEGMFQRIKNIDDIFINGKNKYLEISYLSNINKKNKFIDSTEVISLNYFLHRREIKMILKENNNIYIHSLYNLIKLFGFRKYLNNRYILDFHGTVPEEIKFSGKKFKSKIFEYLESKLCKKVDVGIYVTESMKNFYKDKYEIKKNICYPIYPKNVFENIDKDKIYDIRKNMKISDKDIVIIYSGNAQAWQNIDIMLEQIKMISNEHNYKIIIMTGEKDIIEKKIFENEIKNVDVITIQASELKYYYSIANYGYILRDKNILNKVACPTKLIEYMYYGIIPIVLYDDIGDFKDKGYEFIEFSDINNGIRLENKKSEKNMKIIKDIMDQINTEKLLKFK